MYNGTEVGGGSLRIFNTELQQKMFEKLGFTKEEAWERFGFLMGAFQYGTPPHGGMAYGLDRLVMLLLGRETIKDVIAFPKNNSGRDTMNESPSPIDQSQLDELHLQLVQPEKKQD